MWDYCLSFSLHSDLKSSQLSMCVGACINNNSFPLHFRVKGQRNTAPPSQWWGSFLQIWEENTRGLSLLGISTPGMGTLGKLLGLEYPLIPHFRWISSCLPPPRQTGQAVTAAAAALINKLRGCKTASASLQPKMIVSKIILDQDHQDQQGERKPKE